MNAVERRRDGEGAVGHVPVQHHPVDAVYRGWMISPEAYGLLHASALCAALAVCPPCVYSHWMIALRLAGASGVKYIEQRFAAIRLITMASLLGCLSITANAQSSATTTAVERRDAEQYSAYSAYLEHLLSANYFMKDGKVHFILEGSASPHDLDLDWLFRADDLDRVFQAGTLRADTSADFRRNVAKPLILKPALRLSPRATFTLVRPEQSDPKVTFNDSSVTTVRVVLSPAGFNEEFTQALFLVKFSLYECVGGGYVLMQKAGAEWTVTQGPTDAACL